MSRSCSKSPTPSIRTGYTRRKKIYREKNQVPEIITNNLTTDNYYNSYNKENYREKEKKSNYIKDPLNAKYKNNDNDYYNYYGQKKHFKESNNYDYITKTQITTLPGGVKRNKYEIKDDYYFPKPYNYSRLFKSVYDYNSNINFEQNYDPITQGYNVNTFPTRERYYGSYKKGVQDNDIFNSKFYNKHKYLYDNFYD